MTWIDRTRSIKEGDRVAYSAAFLRSTGQYTGDVPFARGEVTGLVKVGDVTLVEVVWDTPELPGRVNVCNLARVTERGILE